MARGAWQGRRDRVYAPIYVLLGGTHRAWPDLRGARARVSVSRRGVGTRGWSCALAGPISARTPQAHLTSADCHFVSRATCAQLPSRPSRAASGENDTKSTWCHFPGRLPNSTTAASGVPRVCTVQEGRPTDAHSQHSWEPTSLLLTPPTIIAVARMVSVRATRKQSSAHRDFNYSTNVQRARRTARLAAGTTC